MEIKSVYPPANIIDIGDKQDNDPPIFEPVNIYSLPNAYITSYGYVISNFKILKEGVSYRHRNSLNFKNVVSFLFLKKKVHLNKSALSISHGWYDSYYHFTLECLPKLFILKDFLSRATLVFPKKIQNFHSEWFELLGVKNILYVEESEILKTPLAITSSFPARDLNHHHLVMPDFAMWVLSKIDNLNSLGFKKIFIGRKNPKHRILLNLPEIKLYLETQGFVYAEMEDYSIKDQIKLFYNANQIICVHGAALSNLCFSKPGTKVLDLLHEDFKQWCFLKLAIIHNLDYDILDCQGEGDHPLPGYKDIRVNIPNLKNKIEKWN